MKKEGGVHNIVIFNKRGAWVLKVAKTLMEKEVFSFHFQGSLVGPE